MARSTLGLIFSTTGAYAALGRNALAGALAAIEDLRAAGAADIVPVARDPGGEPAAYERATADLLARGVRNIVGAITSWSRKDMIPVLARGGGQLWYPCPYEGFESSEHVVYLGASPNHHVVPLADWIAGANARSVFLVGSNYVWGWETLRLMRERLSLAGIPVVGERYLPLGSTEPSRTVGEIRATGAEVVVNSLIGPSSVAFLRDLARRDPDRVGRTGHVVSCNQTEVDLRALGPAASGLLAAGAFFEADASAALRASVRRHAPGERTTSFLATAYAAVEIFAAASARAGGDDPRAVFDAACAHPNPTAIGTVTIDPVLRHAALRPRLAVARGGRFELLSRADAPVPADPYLTGFAAAPARDLRIVR